MSRYNKLIKEILDGIFEGYALDDSGKLKVVNESAAKTADSALHKLVLEKSRDLWDVLESSTESLADVAEEISFKELNTGPDSIDSPVALTASEGDVEQQAQQMQEPTLENLLGSEDFNLDSIFEDMDHLDHEKVSPMKTPMMDDEANGEEVEDGIEDREDMEYGMDDNNLGSSDMEGEIGEPGDLEAGDEMEPGMEPEMGADPEMDLEPEGGEGEAFDFDLELGGEEELNGEPMGDELEGEPMGDIEGLDLGDEEEEPAEEGMGAAHPYDMR